MKADPVIRPGRCGSHKGKNDHNKYGERLCDACREFHRQYMKARREANGPAWQAEVLREKARQSAVWRLKELHRAEFDLLVAVELRILMSSQRQEGAAS